MKKSEFKGKKAFTDSLFSKQEHQIKDYLVPKVPKWLGTRILTSMSLIWASLIVLFYWLAASDRTWVLGVTAVLILYWLTDNLDGSIGRYRNEGFVKWGFYMDHFIDFIVLCCVFIGFTFILPNSILPMLGLVVVASFYVHAMLSFGVTQEFKTSYMKISPTEVIIIGIIMNVFYYLFGLQYAWISIIMVVTFTVFIAIIVYQKQKELYAIDMKYKKLKK